MGLIRGNANIIILKNKQIIITLDNEIISIVPRTVLSNYYILFLNSLKLSHFHDFISAIVF